MKSYDKIKDKIFDNANSIIPTIKQWKQEKKKIVFTNGCFDLLHLGHIEYLSKASDLGDKLIIGLNTDSSIKRIKGEERPINDEKTRKNILSALFFVDAVVLFNEDTPENLIKQLIPDILVKGKDYDVKNIVGADFVISNGGKVETIDLVEGYSSTNTIKKIKK